MDRDAVLFVLFFISLMLIAFTVISFSWYVSNKKIEREGKIRRQHIQDILNGKK